ncbi:MAG: mannose-1-phosphate guanylyltransferase, partial [Synergistaceae bacterium]|nr:mannose-1-phosphate guanylyltransferase [Synergistaceae bacterium]
MTATLFSIVLAGGSGTRLWPLSRQELPKQYLNLQGNGSLLQETLRRLSSISDASRISVVTGRKSGALTFHQASQILAIGRKSVIEEPVARNTAPAIALGLLHLLKYGGALGNDLAFICPSDHVITDEKKFKDTVEKACIAARQGYIAVFGIPPATPETGFGYIRRGEDKGTFALVDCFVEKPDRKRAALYLDEGSYFWNGGMFLFRIQDMLEELLRWAPEIGEPASRGYDAFAEVFENLPSISIDYAVLEKSEKTAMV